MFLPQAYSNDFGSAASPAACAQGAAGFFPTDAVHPTVGMYAGQGEGPSPERYAALLDEAGTVGFSVYLAETGMDARHWHTLGEAIGELEIARGTAEIPMNSAAGPLSTTQHTSVVLLERKGLANAARENTQDT